MVSTLLLEKPVLAPDFDGLSILGLPFLLPLLIPPLVSRLLPGHLCLTLDSLPFLGFAFFLFLLHKEWDFLDISET